MDTISSSGIIHYDFQELNVTVRKIEQMMGFESGSAPDIIHETIVSVCKEAPKISQARGGYEIIQEFEIEENQIIIDGKTLFPGNIVTPFIRKSEALAFFIFTAGKQIESLSRTCFEGNDPMRGYAYDVLGSETVEAATGKMIADLEKQLLQQGMKITNPYSPGYCGWPIKDQHQLFALFPDKFCGITLSSTSLMNPIKSVSGLIGIGSDVKKNPYSCQICDAENCLYRDKK